MHRNQLPPPAADHHSEDEESESEEESEEEEVEDQQKPQVGAKATSSFDDESESEEEGEEEEEEEGSSEKTPSQIRAGGLDYNSDGDSDRSLSSPTASAFEIKHNPKIKEVNSKKPPAEEVNGGGSGGGGSDDPVKKASGSHRLWTPEDELKILKGMVDYKKNCGLDPNSNMTAFFDFVKGSLIADADATKLKDKIRRLKEKYIKNAKKEADGETLALAKTHEAEGYEQSKKIWGGIVAGSNGGAQAGGAKKKTSVNGSTSGGSSSGVNVAEAGTILALPAPDPEEVKKEVNVMNGPASGKGVKRVRKVKKMELDEAEEVEDEDYMSYIPVKEFGFVVKEGLKLADREKVTALNEKWKSYEIDAGKQNLKKMKLMLEHEKLILDAVTSS